MNKEQFRDYIDCFNRNDFAGFTRYYADDVLLELPKMQLRGPQAIIDFYRVVKARVRETLKINEVIADSEGLAAEVDTEFLALEDWPDFIVGPLKKGDAIRIVSFVHYKIRDGRFAHIKSARFRTLT
jgi:sulfur carrier protein ThiS